MVKNIVNQWGWSKAPKCCFHLVKFMCFIQLITRLRNATVNPFLTQLFFICYLAAAWPLLVHCREGSLTNPMLVTAFTYFDRKITGSFITRLGSDGLAKHPVMFELGTF